MNDASIGHARRPLTRRAALAGAATLLATALAASASAQADIQEQIIGQLEQQGYRIRRVERTWLGRVRILAESNRYDREVVFVPATGEILRDYWKRAASSPARDDDARDGKFDDPDQDDADDDDGDDLDDGNDDIDDDDDDDDDGDDGDDDD